MRHLISLGHRCDVAFQLRMHGQDNVAHFFDWLATSADAVTQIIAADFDVFYPDHLLLMTDVSPHYVMDRLTGVAFHHQFPMFAGHVPADFLLHYDAFIKKFDYLAERFRQYVSTKPVTLVRHQISKDEALRLEEAVIKRFPDADVRFLYLIDQVDTFETPFGHARYFLSDESSLGEPAVWATMLTEEGLIEFPYRHATAEILGNTHDDHNLSTENRFTESQLIAAVKANPRASAFALELSKYYHLHNEHAKSEEFAMIAAANSSDEAAARHLIALAQWRQGRIDVQTAANILCTLADGKVSSVLLRDCVAALAEAGRRVEALVYVDRALRIDAVNYWLYFEKAKLLLQAERFMEANLAIDRAMELGTYPDAFLHVKAKILEGLGQSGDAIALERQAIAMGAGFQSIFNLGGLCLRTGQYEEAVAIFESLLASACPHADTVQRFLDEAKQHIVDLYGQPAVEAAANDDV
jgi:tetratricopeptide (TPR) repeat protein